MSFKQLQKVKNEEQEIRKVLEDRVDKARGEGYRVYFMMQNIPQPRRINGVTKNELMTEKVNPKSGKIGTQMQSMDENVLDSQMSLYVDDFIETDRDHDKESIKGGEGQHAFATGTGSFSQSPMTVRNMTMGKEYLSKSNERGVHWPECEYIQGV